MTTKNKESWPEIDLLRGFAVIFMLVNHSVLSWTNYEDGNHALLSALFFVGSYAPAIFFFVTGVGYGVAHKVGKVASFSSVFFKVIILLIADVFLRGALSTSFPTFGLDFLGFIGLSMLVLYALRGRFYGVLLAIILLVVILFLRFAFPKFLNLYGIDIGNSYYISVFTGQAGYKISGFSYWLVPWLIYPLAGFLLGVLIEGRKAYIESSKLIPLCLLVVGIFTSIVSAYLLSKGLPIFRWGSMSFNFFISSIACISLLLFLVCIFFRFEVFTRLISPISLRGVSSLAIVPIHYFFIHIYSYYNIDSMPSSLYLFVAPLWIGLCITLANLVQSASLKSISYNSPMVKWVAVFFLLVSILLKVFFPVSPINFMVSFFAEIVLCFMLSFNFQKTKVSS